MKIKNKEYLLEGLFLLFLFGLYLSYALVQPFNVAPDESMRFQIVKYIFDSGSLPHGGDPLIRNELWGNSYGFTPILPYMFSALFMKITSFFTSNEFDLLISARMVSVLCGVITGFFCIKISKKLFEQKGYRMIFVCLCTLLPQFAFVNSFVSCDSMAVMATAMIFYAWIITIKSDWSVKSCILLAVGIAFCALSYYNAYGFILCSIALLFISFFLLKDDSIQWKKFFRCAIIISAIVIILIAWWFIRNAIIYNGDFLGMRTCDQYAEMYASPDLKPSLRETPLNTGVSLISMLVAMDWIQFTLVSFIGVFGYANLFIPYNFVYIIYVAFFVLFFLGFLFSLRHIGKMLKGKSGRQQVVFNALSGICVIIPIAISIFYSYTSDFQPQGRYLLPALIPMMYLFTIGARELMEKFIKNKKVQACIQYIFCTAYALMPIYCLVFVIYPQYHP